MVATDRFAVLARDNFTCAYCGEKPGHSELEVDHIIPVAMGGSNNLINLVCSCKRCNRGKSGRVVVPNSKILDRDDSGWNIIESSGIWAIKTPPFSMSGIDAWVTGAIYTGTPAKSANEYCFEGYRCHELDWENHIHQKAWEFPHTYGDFADILYVAREYYENHRSQ